MIYYAGDTHGRVDAIKSIDAIAIQRGIKVVVQVGDFGCHFQPGMPCKVAAYFEEREAGPEWYTCGGNHDNWPEWMKLREAQGGADVVRLAKGCFFVNRGTMIELDEKSHLFFGGAESTDQHMRSEGRDWWPSETPSRDEFYSFFDALNEGQPDVVVTHDAPLRVVIKRHNRDMNATPNGLEKALEHGDHHPRTWVFGHHHQVKTWTIEDTKFYCCGLHGQFVAI